MKIQDVRKAYDLADERGTLLVRIECWEKLGNTFPLPDFVTAIVVSVTVPPLLPDGDKMNRAIFNAILSQMKKDLDPIEDELARLGVEGFRAKGGT